MQLTSIAFSHGGDLPRILSCEGGEQSPPLSWSDIPADARSLALIVDDPDAPDPAAPKMTWVHWVLYNLPAQSSGLAAGSDGKPPLPAGTLHGLNDWQQTGYRGPCPPIGRHRYVHKLYALDRVLPALADATKASLVQAMHGHILAQCELVGYYQKNTKRSL